MTGKFLPNDSWEKQTVFKLNNGWTATVEYSHYGEMVSRLDSPNRKTFWHCSNGDKGLPEFAWGWSEIVVKSAGTSIIRPKFNKLF